jgi:hypothetical protein
VNNITLGQESPLMLIEGVRGAGHLCLAAVDNVFRARAAYSSIFEAVQDRDSDPTADY